MQNIALPLSKSILNRCLILSALSRTPINYLPHHTQLPNDTVVMKRVLFENNSNIFNVEDAGTVFRFLTAYLAVTPSEHLLFGTNKLNARPIKSLVEALVQLGAEISYLGQEGEAPLKIIGKELLGGEISLDASASSQFVSALMLIAPTCQLGLKINLSKVTSYPYILTTKYCLEYFGVTSSVQNATISIPFTPTFRLNNEALSSIETDWSSASYWYALCAVTGKSFSFAHLTLNSIQGDVICAEVFQKLGVETNLVENEIQIGLVNPIHKQSVFNLQSSPDIAPALIVACALMNIEVKFYGLQSLELKESNRVVALATELKKLNIEFVRQDDCWLLCSSEYPNFSSKLLCTYNDHRLAMAFASIKALHVSIEIENPNCVAKSYPMFWEEFYKIYEA